jgi:hypothetical protein
MQMLHELLLGISKVTVKLIEPAGAFEQKVTVLNEGTAESPVMCGFSLPPAIALPNR